MCRDTGIPNCGPIATFDGLPISGSRRYIVSKIKRVHLWLCRRVTAGGALYSTKRGASRQNRLMILIVTSHSKTCDSAKIQWQESISVNFNIIPGIGALNGICLQNQRSRFRNAPLRPPFQVNSLRRCQGLPASSGISFRGFQRGPFPFMLLMHLPLSTIYAA
jgi:hypothetical protein